MHICNFTLVDNRPIWHRHSLWCT